MEEFLSIAQLADSLRCSTSFIYKHHRSVADPIPVACYVGNRPRFRLGEVTSWLNAGRLNDTYGSLPDGSVAVRDRRRKVMSRRRHQKGHVQLRGNVYRGLYRNYPVGKNKWVNLGTKDEITKRQAEKKLAKIIDKMEAEALLVEDQAQEANGVMTLKRYIEGHYMTEFWPNLRPGTRKAYKQIIDARIIPELGAVELNNVGRSDVQLLITNSRPKRNRDQVRLARHTVDNIRTVLGSIFREAELSKYLTDTPVYKIKMPVKDPKRKVAIPDAELVQTVVDSLKEPYRTLTWFVATMGCRIGEAFGLKWNAVDFAGKKIWFLEARYMGKEEHLTKGHRAQTPVYLTDFEVARLKAFKAMCENQGEDDLVFLDHGKPLTEDHALQQQLQKAAERKGLHLTFHGLRHWAGTMLYRAGVPIKDIQARLGHSRWQTTADWYIEENDQGQQNAAEIASRFLRPVPNAQATIVVNNSVQSATIGISHAIATRTATMSLGTNASA